MTEDATISLLSDATHIACRRMTPQHLDALVQMRGDREAEAK